MSVSAVGIVERAPLVLARAERSEANGQARPSVDRTVNRAAVVLASPRGEAPSEPPRRDPVVDARLAGRAPGPAPEDRPDQVAGQSDSSRRAGQTDDNGQTDETGQTGQGGQSGETDEAGQLNELTEDEQRQVDELEARDREVRAHEMAHVAAGGAHVTSGPTYSYQQGPDGKRYAVGGEVGIDTSPEDDPEATIAKMQQVRAAALAPAEPSGQDRAVAAAAAQQAAAARAELAKERAEEATGDSEATGDTTGQVTASTGPEAATESTMATHHQHGPEGACSHCVGSRYLATAPLGSSS